MEEPIKPSLNLIFFHRLQSISAFFFFLFGSVYFGLALILSASPDSALSLWFHILDIPFALISLTYATSSIKMSLLEHQLASRHTDTILIIVNILLFGTVLYLNFGSL